MASDQAPVSAATPSISGGIPELGSVPPTTVTGQSNTDASNIKSLKRNRPEQLLNPSGVTTIANAGLTASPSPKSPRYTGAFSPRFSPAPLTGAAALEDERRRKEDQQKSAGSVMSENPSHKALSSLIAGGGAAMSKPQDAPIATTSMSGAMSTVANAISIPSPLHYDEKSETSPASATSLASLGSTAQTATASTTAAASPATVLGPSDKELRDSRSLLSADDNTNSDDKPSNRALSFPGNVLRDQDSSRLAPNSSAARGMSLPMSGVSQLLAPRTYSHKKHKCPYCETEFTRHHNLKSHLLTHSQEKPYVCQTCQMRFRRLHDLKRHTKLHTGERPHICPKCDRKFARGDALARHSKGHGGCAGRRTSTGSFGGDDDFEGSHMGEGEDSGMDGIIYDEPAEQNDGASDEERRFSLPSIKAQHVGSGHGAQEVYTPHARTPSTYPPAGPRPPRQRAGGLYPPSAERGGSGSSAGTSTSIQNSMAGGPSANTSMSTAASPVGNSMFSQTGMTESPKPLSPAGSSHQLGNLDPSSINRQRSPSLTTQFQQQHFGRRPSERSSPQGMSLPSPYSSKLPALSGLAPPESRYTLPSQSSSHQAATNGSQATPQGQLINPSNPGNPAFQPHMSGSAQGRGSITAAPHHHGSGSGSGDSSSNLFASGDRGVWNYIQSLEEKVRLLSERVTSMENFEKGQEEKIVQLSNELNSLRNHLNSPTQLIHPPQPAQLPNAPGTGHM